MNGSLWHSFCGSRNGRMRGRRLSRFRALPVTHWNRGSLTRRHPAAALPLSSAARTSGASRPSLLECRARGRRARSLRLSARGDDASLSRCQSVFNCLTRVTWLTGRVCDTSCKEGTKALVVGKRPRLSARFPPCLTAMQRLRSGDQTAQAASAIQLQTRLVVTTKQTTREKEGKKKKQGQSIEGVYTVQALTLNCVALR